MIIIYIKNKFLNKLKLDNHFQNMNFLRFIFYFMYLIIFKRISSFIYL